MSYVQVQGHQNGYPIKARTMASGPCLVVGFIVVIAIAIIATQTTASSDWRVAETVNALHELQRHITYHGDVLSSADQVTLDALHVDLTGESLIADIEGPKWNWMKDQWVVRSRIIAQFASEAVRMRYMLPKAQRIIAKHAEAVFDITERVVPGYVSPARG